MVRFWSIVLGLGLLGVWLNSFLQSPLSPWIAWLDGFFAIAAFAVALAAHPSKPRKFRAGITGILSTLLFGIWLIAILTHAPLQPTWWTFVFAIGFAVIAVTSAPQSSKPVIRHPDTRQLANNGRQDKPLPSNELTSEEIWEIYGPHNLGGFGYQPRAGYLDRNSGGDELTGKYWGVGPKGFLRSDVQIADEISEKLARRGDLNASGIEIDVRMGDVTLRGTVNSRAARRLAEAICDSVLGVANVHNELKIAQAAS